jgi:hypothetical protein
MITYICEYDDLSTAQIIANDNHEIIEIKRGGNYVKFTDKGISTNINGIDIDGRHVKAINDGFHYIVECESQNRVYALALLLSDMLLESLALLSCGKIYKINQPLVGDVIHIRRFNLSKKTNYGNGCKIIQFSDGVTSVDDEYGTLKGISIPGFYYSDYTIHSFVPDEQSENEFIDVVSDAGCKYEGIYNYDIVLDY